MNIFASFAALFVAFTSLLCAQEAVKQGDTVHFSKIIPLLPAPPSGWTAQEADGATTDAAGFKMTTVSRTYTKGDASEAPTVTISIIDSASNKQFFDATTAAWSFSQETTAGYMKSVKIGEYPGFEIYEKSNNSGTISVVVEQRFFVTISTSNLDPAQIQTWVKMVDLKKLAALK